MLLFGKKAICPVKMSEILLEKVNHWKVYLIITICITNACGELKDELNQNIGDYIIAFPKWFLFLNIISWICAWLSAAENFEMLKSLETFNRWSTHYLNKRNMAGGFILKKQTYLLWPN